MRELSQIAMNGDSTTAEQNGKWGESPTEKRRERHRSDEPQQLVSTVHEKAFGGAQVAKMIERKIADALRRVSSPRSRGRGNRKTKRPKPCNSQ